MPKINVLFVQSQTYFGADSRIHGLIMRHLDRDRFSVHVACNAGDKRTKSAALTELDAIPDLRIRPMSFGPTLNGMGRREAVQQALGTGSRGAADLAGLLAYARKNRIHIVHGTEKPRDALYGLIVARLVGAQAITHLHVKVEGWMSRNVRFAMKHDDALLACSDFVAESAVAFGYPRSKVHTVLNALDLEGWDPSIDGRGVRQELGIPETSPVLAIVSRVFPWKGHTLLLHALAHIKDRVPDFRLLIVGEEDPRATPGGSGYVHELERLVGTLRLDQQVIFTGFRSDIPRVLAACDIYAMPTFEEPFGVVFLEAMAMKTPVISLASGGVPEVVEHGRSALLSAPDDVDGLAANLECLLNNPSKRRTMGEHGRCAVETRFTPARLVDDVAEVYERLVAGVARSR